MALALVLAGGGCVGRDLERVNETEAEYRRCVEDHSESYGECRALREQMLSEQQRYEDNARRRWACDPASDECPTPR